MMKTPTDKKADTLIHVSEIHKNITIATVTLLLLLLGVILWRIQPPVFKRADAASDQFSAVRAGSEYRGLSSATEPHAVGSEAHARLQQSLINKFSDLGYRIEIQKSFSCAAGICAPIQNLMTRLPGRESGPALMLVAHYDSVPAGPGVADDGAGIATILEIARIAKTQAPFRNPIIFLLTDAEEIGSLGAEAFAAEHPWKREVGVVINLEARGTGGLNFMFETSENNAWLVKAYAASVSRPTASSLFFEIYRHMPNFTDLTVFKREKIAGYNFAFIKNGFYYHTPLDNFANLDPGSLQHQGDQALALLRRLAESDLAHPSEENAVYADLLGFTVLWWPESWNLSLTILIGLLFSAMLVYLFCKNGLQVRFLASGFVIWLFAVLMPVLLGFAFQWLIAKLTDQAGPSYAHPLPMRLILWSGVIFSGLVFTTWISKRVPFRELGLATWLGWAGLALVGALLLPGITILFLIPATVLTLALLAARLLPLKSFELALQTAFLAAALVSGLLWLPLALIMETALNFDLTPAITLPLALVMTSLLPLFRPSKKGLRISKWLLLISAVVMMTCVAIVIFLPPYSKARPQLLNFIYYEDHNSAKAYWAAHSPQRSLPSSVRRAGKFRAIPERIFPWSTTLTYAAEAGSSAEPAPEIRKDSEQVVGEERIIEARLQSPRGANRIWLIIPPEVPLIKISVEGKPISIPSITNIRNPFKMISCWGVPRRGFRVELHLAKGGSSEVILVDLSPGLPKGGQELINARLPAAVPFQDGDMTMYMRRFEL